MSRPFEFDERTRDEAFFRQWNRCAHCGRSLLDLFDHAHHVVPNQVGRPGESRDAWIREVDNCVILCESCHTRVHEDGRFRSGAVASPGDFPHSHGPEQSLHAGWAARMSPRFWGR